MENTNKGSIYISTTSPPSVIREYHEQFQRDFFMFLKCRAEEMVGGGRMVLTILGRRSDDPCSKECCYHWDLLAETLNDMVVEVTIYFVFMLYWILIILSYTCPLIIILT
ncbi:putative methyltransferase [Helianthus anomalus]